MSKKKNKSRKKRGATNRTPIAKHRLAKKILTPPLAELPNTSLTNWANDRLPDLLWMALIRYHYGQLDGLNIFREVLRFTSYHERSKEMFDLSHSGIASLEDGLKAIVIDRICSLTAASECLSPLRLFDSLPDIEIWKKHIPPLQEGSLQTLMGAVGSTLWHQSQESTDIRWLVIMLMISGQRVCGLDEDMVKEFMGYPDVGDQRKVRPSIRSMEMAFRNPSPDGNPRPHHPWPNQFWLTCWENTPCQLMEQSEEATKVDNPNRENLFETWKELVRHWDASHSTTKIDAKHDAVFGLVLYAFKIAFELWSGPHAQGVLGRLGLRSIFEARITLKYLLTENNEELWAKWRNYGSGQAKLSALRFDDDTPAPEFISLDMVDAIASEDKWEEFVQINLGSWSESNLRDLSVKAGVKEEYDAYYSWSSSYSHCSWGAVRESCFETCVNPLHRLHRMPKPRWLPSVNRDVELLLNRMLDDLDSAYPDFKIRVSATASSEQEKEAEPDGETKTSS